jgi:hypothetical protein
MMDLPTHRPAHGGVTPRAYESRDVAMVRDPATDPTVPLIGTLPAHADMAVDARLRVD